MTARDPEKPENVIAFDSLGQREARSESDRKRTTAVGLFNLLREFAERSTKQILEVDQYVSHLWFSDIPKNSSCFCRTWGLSEGRDPDIWMEVRKQSEPACPLPPNECIPWLASPLPLSSETPPTLLERIADPEIVTREPADDEGDENPQRFLFLCDHPQIDLAWARFLDERWAPWAKTHRVWKEHHRVYADLFSTRQFLIREGERYETVLGLGLLNLRLSSGQVVRRHVLTVPAALSFDAEAGVFTVGPPADGIRPNLELDMLDPEHRPPASFGRSFEEFKHQISEDPWETGALEGFLKAFVQTIDDRGEYLDEPNLTNIPSSHPVISISPAFVLRRRTAKGMVEAFRHIIDSLEAEGEVPPAIDLLVSSDAEVSERTTSASGQRDPGRVYFPKPTNKEQLAIVERLGAARGVLVQGPPGTGKSHTIANLICHLLAEGKRVLVTAQTPRALNVLRDKIPEEIRPLCVSLLGNDRESLDAMQQSVGGISDKDASWDSRQAKVECEALDRELDVLLEKRAAIDRDLRDLREDETVRREIAGGTYRGTAQEIAKRVNDEHAVFEWFTDTPDDTEQPLEMSPNELLTLLRDCRELTADRLRELEMRLPDGAEVPNSVQLAPLATEESQAVAAVTRAKESPLSSMQRALFRAPFEQVDQLAEAVEELYRRVQTARRRPLFWIENAVYDVLTGDDTMWVELRRDTAELLKDTRELARAADRRQIRLPKNREDAEILADAKDVLSHARSAGNLGWLSQQVNPVLRRSRYIFREVIVDGRQCRGTEAIEALVDYLTLRNKLRVLWKQWAEYTDEREGTYSRQISRLEDNLEALNSVLAVHETVEETRSLVDGVQGLPQPAWHKEESSEGLRILCAGRRAEQSLERIRAEIGAIERALVSVLERPGSHPISRKFLDAVRSRDAEQLVELRKGLQELLDDRDRAEGRQARLKRLATQAPRLAESVANSSDDPAWEERLRNADRAWQWSQAKSWLGRIQEPGRLEEANRRYLEVGDQILQKTERLAANLAWQSCLNRLTEEHRRHLEAWQLAMRRLGKGTGKHAPVHRREARRNLAKCRGAIPAWIMPLYQLYDSVQPEPGMFDVVIVDEASQCGLDALILLYLGTQIVIVGDDEQISPTVMRFPHDEFRQVVSRNLPDFELAGVFHPDTSIFDLGRVWFRDRIQLREHFRCMPEIIRFSDDLCYRNLIPLRQYPPNRLPPVQTVHIPSGVQRGRSSNAINPPEARAVVDKVVECCQSDRYLGKTIGVISLLGSAQGHYIERMLLDRLDPEEIEKRRIVCGDSYSFQGDERDVMFLSLVTALTGEQGEEISSRARVQKGDKQRFNVAASRPKDQLWLFHSVTLDDLRNPDDLRRQLLQHCLNPGRPPERIGELKIVDLRTRSFSSRERQEQPPEPFDSWFEVDVFLQLHEKGFRVFPQFEMAGYRIDLVVEGNQGMLAVECDGDRWHGPERYLQDLDRQRRLQRAGWTFWRVRGSEYYADPERALEDLWRKLESLGITPGVTTEPAPPEVHEPDEDAKTDSDVSDPQRPKEPPSTVKTQFGRRDDLTLRREGHSLPYEDRDDEVPTTKQEPEIEPDRESVAETRDRATSSIEVPKEPKLVRTWKSSINFTEYTAWVGHGLQDPLSAPSNVIDRALIEIVEKEGPIVTPRLFRIYTQGSGKRRTGRRIRKKLSQSVNRLVRRMAIVREHHDVGPRDQVAVLRLPNQKSGVVRTLGGRTLSEVPPTELGALMAQIMDVFHIRASSSHEPIFRRVLDFYGLKKLSSKAQMYLSTVFADDATGVAGSHEPASAPQSSDAQPNKTRTVDGTPMDPLPIVLEWLERNPGLHSSYDIMVGTGLDYDLWPVVRERLKLESRVRVSGKKRGTRYEWARLRV